MSNLVTNKLVFITGASSGIGEACAEIFAQQGAKLLLCARRTDRLNELVKRLQKTYFCQLHHFELDVCNAAAVIEKISALPSEWQAIDILINNAGLAVGLDKLYAADIDDWERMIDTNVKGLLYITRAVLPGMVKRNQGHIINMGSIAGHEYYPAGSVYCATKHAVKAISKCLKIDLLGAQVRVTSVDPGMVKTEFSQVRFKNNVERAAAVYQNITPLTAHDIADAVYYCASRPAHVNIAEMIILPTDQASANHVHRSSS